MWEIVHDAHPDGLIHSEVSICAEVKGIIVVPARGTEGSMAAIERIALITNTPYIATQTNA